MSNGSIILIIENKIKRLSNSIHLVNENEALSFQLRNHTDNLINKQFQRNLEDIILSIKNGVSFDKIILHHQNRLITRSKDAVDNKIHENIELATLAQTLEFLIGIHQEQ